MFAGVSVCLDCVFECVSGALPPKKWTLITGFEKEKFKRSVVEHWRNSGKSVVEVAKEFGLNVWNLRDCARSYAQSQRSR